jgi:hypothetical protein
MSLTKDVWDKVQIIQNDILLWQPRFLSKLDNDPEPTTSTDTNKSDYGRSSSILSQSHERLGQPDSIQTQSLFSIVAVMSTGTWDLHCTPTGTYRLQFSEFRYFAAIKHLCQVKAILNLININPRELKKKKKKKKKKNG